LSGEASSVDWRFGVDGHAEHVDGDMMVIPTQRDEIVGVVVTAEMSLVDVVDLEPVP
jgi:hypothetical protein